MPSQDVRVACLCNLHTNPTAVHHISPHLVTFIHMPSPLPRLHTCMPVYSAPTLPCPQLWTLLRTAQQPATSIYLPLQSSHESYCFAPQ
eukprot:c13615_g2_i1 orf=2-265(-)